MSQLITIILCTYRRVRTWYPVVITSVHHQTHHLPARPAHSLPGRVSIRASITWLSCHLPLWPREIGGAAGVTGQRGQEAAKLQTDRLPTLLTVQLTAQQDPVRLVSGMMQTMQIFPILSIPWIQHHKRQMYRIFVIQNRSLTSIFCETEKSQLILHKIHFCQQHGQYLGVNSQPTLSTLRKSWWYRNNFITSYKKCWPAYLRDKLSIREIPKFQLMKFISTAKGGCTVISPGGMVTWTYWGDSPDNL